MTRISKVTILVLLLAVIFCASASADFTAKTKMTMSGIPMMGNISMELTYFIKPGAIATSMVMNNPMMAQMGQPTEQESRTIVRDGGKEILILNFAEKTYSKLDGATIDSAMAMIDNLGGMLDSLKKMVEIKKVDIRMTGNKKKISGLSAEEMAMDMEMVMNAPMGGPKPVPINFTITGSQWGTKDFADYKNYKAMAEKMMSMMMGSGQSGMAGFAKVFEMLGIDETQMQAAKNFSEFLPVGGAMTISMNMSMPEEQKSMQMPGMNFNIQMNTELIEASTAAIPENVFAIPDGFTEVKFDLSGGGLSIPGMGQF